MQIYQVGGSVRDALLGLAVEDRDWVVVGGTVQEMLDLGFRPVGKDFPVFLHPESHEEYALARTERKTAPGYKGFMVHAEPSVTLEQDLERRDLTINAIARSPRGELIDPFGGLADLQAGILRHVSPAFVEDPVRVLRLARFAARFGFAIAPETRDLIHTMVASGELTHLVPERVWQECAKALAGPNPQRFFTALRELGALAVCLPEVDRLFGVPQHPKWHPEIDTGVHVMLVLEQAARLTDNLMVRFGALTHDLGKGTTPESQWPNHAGHEARGVEITQTLCERLRVPTELRAFGMKMARYHTHVHLAFELSDAELLGLIEGLDALRKPEIWPWFLQVGEADFRGRPGYETQAMPELAWLQACYEAVQAVPVAPFLSAGLQGSAIGDAHRAARIAAIAQLRQTLGH